MNYSDEIVYQYRLVFETPDYPRHTKEEEKMEYSAANEY